MQLSDEVYLVGGGDYGFNLSHRLDCHTYVVDGGDELVLIDAGFGPGTDEILANMRRDGLDPARVAQDRRDPLPRGSRRRPCGDGARHGSGGVGAD